LFVCARNRLRSPTAEAIFIGLEGIEVASAGTAPDAECQISLDLVEWADEIFVMERRQKAWLNMRFAPELHNKTIRCLGIPDRYEYMQQELVDVLKQRVLPLLGRE
jgi:predicted protein tyrosine phosphatase